MASQTIAAPVHPKAMEGLANIMTLLYHLMPRDKEFVEEAPRMLLQPELSHLQACANQTSARIGGGGGSDKLKGLFIGPHEGSHHDAVRVPQRAQQFHPAVAALLRVVVKGKVEPEQGKQQQSQPKAVQDVDVNPILFVHHSELSTDSVLSVPPYKPIDIDHYHVSMNTTYAMKKRSGERDVQQTQSPTQLVKALVSGMIKTGDGDEYSSKDVMRVDPWLKEDILLSLPEDLRHAYDPIVLVSEKLISQNYGFALANLGEIREIASPASLIQPVMANPGIKDLLTCFDMVTNQMHGTRSANNFGGAYLSETIPERCVLKGLNYDCAFPTITPTGGIYRSYWQLSRKTNPMASLIEFAVSKVERRNHGRTDYVPGFSIPYSTANFDSNALSKYCGTCIEFILGRLAERFNEELVKKNGVPGASAANYQEMFRDLLAILTTLMSVVVESPGEGEVPYEHDPLGTRPATGLLPHDLEAPFLPKLDKNSGIVSDGQIPTAFSHWSISMAKGPIGMVLAQPSNPQVPWRMINGALRLYVCLPSSNNLLKFLKKHERSLVLANTLCGVILSNLDLMRRWLTPILGNYSIGNSERISVFQERISNFMNKIMKDGRQSSRLQGPVPSTSLAELSKTINNLIHAKRPDQTLPFTQTDRVVSEHIQRVQDLKAQLKLMDEIIQDRERVAPLVVVTAPQSEPLPLRQQPQQSQPLAMILALEREKMLGEAELHAKSAALQATQDLRRDYEERLQALDAQMKVTFQKLVSDITGEITSQLMNRRKEQTEERLEIVQSIESINERIESLVQSKEDAANKTDTVAHRLELLEALSLKFRAVEAKEKEKQAEGEGLKKLSNDEMDAEEPVPGRQRPRIPTAPPPPPSNNTQLANAAEQMDVDDESEVDGDVEEEDVMSEDEKESLDDLSSPPIGLSKLTPQQRFERARMEMEEARKELKKRESEQKAQRREERYALKAEKVERKASKSLPQFKTSKDIILRNGSWVVEELFMTNRLLNYFKEQGNVALLRHPEYHRLYLQNLIRPGRRLQMSVHKNSFLLPTFTMRRSQGRDLFGGDEGSTVRVVDNLLDVEMIGIHKAKVNTSLNIQSQPLHYAFLPVRYKLDDADESNFAGEGDDGDDDDVEFTMDLEAPRNPITREMRFDLIVFCSVVPGLSSRKRKGEVGRDGAEKDAEDDRTFGITNTHVIIFDSRHTEASSGYLKSLANEYYIQVLHPAAFPRIPPPPPSEKTPLPGIVISPRESKSAEGSFAHVAVQIRHLLYNPVTLQFNKRKVSTAGGVGEIIMHSIQRSIFINVENTRAVEVESERFKDFLTRRKTKGGAITFEQKEFALMELRTRRAKAQLEEELQRVTFEDGDDDDENERLEATIHELLGEDTPFTVADYWKLRKEEKVLYRSESTYSAYAQHLLASVTDDPEPAFNKDDIIILKGSELKNLIALEGRGRNPALLKDPNERRLAESAIMHRLFVAPDSNVPNALGTKVVFVHMHEQIVDNLPPGHEESYDEPYFIDWMIAIFNFDQFYESKYGRKQETSFQSEMETKKCTVIVVDPTVHPNDAYSLMKQFYKSAKPSSKAPPISAATTSTATTTGSNPTESASAAAVLDPMETEGDGKAKKSGTGKKTGGGGGGGTKKTPKPITEEEFRARRANVLKKRMPYGIIPLPANGQDGRKRNPEEKTQKEKEKEAKYPTPADNIPSDHSKSFVPTRHMIWAANALAALVRRESFETGFSRLEGVPENFVSLTDIIKQNGQAISGGAAKQTLVVDGTTARKFLPPNFRTFYVTSTMLTDIEVEKLKLKAAKPAAEVEAKQVGPIPVGGEQERAIVEAPTLKLKAPSLQEVLKLFTPDTSGYRLLDSFKFMLSTLKSTLVEVDSNVYKDFKGLEMRKKFIRERLSNFGCYPPVFSVEDRHIRRYFIEELFGTQENIHVNVVDWDFDDYKITERARELVQKQKVSNKQKKKQQPPNPQPQPQLPQHKPPSRRRLVKLGDLEDREESGDGDNEEESMKSLDFSDEDDYYGSDE